MTQELAIYRSIDDTMTLGKLLAQSGYFADSRDAGQAVVKVLAGAELGFGPIASMTGINIIKGKVTLSANLIAAAIKRSGRYNYRVRKMTDTECEIVFYEGKEEIGVSTFTAKDAANAGLSGDNWRKFPRNMLFARAISNGAKWYCPDLSGGPLYTPDELGAQVDGETGEVVDAPSQDNGAQAQADHNRVDWKVGPSGERLDADPPGFAVWADWSRPEHAIQWALSQGVFGHQKHAENAYNKVKTECKPKKASDMWQCWYADVMRRIEDKSSASVITDAELDGEQDETPQFS